MNRRRKLLLALAGSALSTPFISFAQQQRAKIARIGFLGSTTASGYASKVEALRAGLRDLGYVEGKNLFIEFRWADGRIDRLPALAAELIRLNVDVIVTFGTPGTSAAKRATTTIPIVMAVSGDAVATGLVASLARPGGNVTGTTFFNIELAVKRLELVKEAMPHVAKVAVFVNPENRINRPIIEALKNASTSLNLILQETEVRGPIDFGGAFQSMAKANVHALMVNDDPMLIAAAAEIGNLAAKQRLPSIGFIEYAEAGGVMGYGADRRETFYRAAHFVDRILKGANPADIPVEQPMKFEFVVNKKAAKMLGITFPQLILVRADRVIE